MSPRNQHGKRGKKRGQERTKDRQASIEDSSVAASGLSRRLSPRLAAKHASTSLAKETVTLEKLDHMPPSSPKSEKQPPTPPKSPHQQTLSGVVEEDGAPNSLNKRPRKRHEGSMDTAASKLHENLGPSNVEEEGKEGVSSGPLPYVEVKLPDGRLIRQCRASDGCPLSESFIEKRDRMERHLREKHGIHIKIPKRNVGRPTNKQIQSRPRRTFPHPYAETWKKQAAKRALDKDKKFKKNQHTYEHLQYLRAEEAWNELRKEFKTTTKDEYIASWVEGKMKTYMSTASERAAKIERRIEARGKTKVKDVPAWLHVVMDDLDQQEKQDDQQKDDQQKDNEDHDDHTDGELVSEHGVYVEALHSFVNMDIGKERTESNMKEVGEETFLGNDEVVKETRKKLPIRSSRRKQGRNDTVPIIVSSPTSNEESNQL